MTIRVHGREVVVKRTPLEAVRANFRTTALVQPRPGCLVLRASGGMLLFASSFLGIGLLVLTLGVVGLAAEGPTTAATWSCLAIGVAFTAGGAWLLLLPRRYEFDRDAGHLKRRRLLVVTVRPLTDVLAVQLLDGGYHRDDEGGGYHTWQLNLILDDEAEPRCNLSNHANRLATVVQADRLAEFLGVPLLDHLAERKEPER